MKRIICIAAIALVVAGVAVWLCNSKSDDRSMPESQNGAKSATRIAEVEPSPNRARAVQLACRTVELEGDAAKFPEFGIEQQPTADGRVPYAVMCPGGVDGAVIDKAESLGAKVMGYIPQDTIAVMVNRESYAKLAADETFAAAVELGPGDKVQPELKAMCEKGGVVAVTVVVHDMKDLKTVCDMVDAGGGNRRDKDLPEATSSFVADIPSGLVAELAKHAEVNWVEPWNPPRACNDEAANHMNVNSVWGGTTLNLTGAGQTLVITDTGIDNTHADFSGQLVGIGTTSGSPNTDTHGHGTHTAGSIIGNGQGSNGTYKGIAYGAKLYVWQCGSNFSYPKPFNNRFRPNGISSSICSESWSSASQGLYISDCKEMDEWCWNNPDYLIVRSAGNDGNNEFKEKTICTPSTAKNILCVGATEDARILPYQDWIFYKNYYGRDQSLCDNFAQVWPKSSCGPTADGRYKPDIVAPGSYVISTKSSQASDQDTFNNNNKYCFKSGTSMSTPLTAGTAALVREWLMRYRGFGSTADKLPTSAMIKAVLIGGTTNLKLLTDNNAKRNYPDERQGFGLVNLANSVNPTSRHVYLKDRMPFARGCTNTFTVVTTAKTDLDAALVWIDYPAQQMYSAKTLVNDLDLSIVRRSDGQVFYPNGGNTYDRLNNVEKMHFTDLPAGTYTVRVAGHDVPYDYTKGGAAALYLSGAFNENDIVYYSPLETANEKSAIMLKVQ